MQYLMMKNVFSENLCNLNTVIITWAEIMVAHY
jgi:hypothetical protein